MVQDRRRCGRGVRHRAVSVVAWIVGKLVGFPAGCVAAGLILAVVAAVYGAWWMFESHGTRRGSVNCRFVAGCRSRTLTDSLATTGVIRHRCCSAPPRGWEGFDRKLHVGLYEFPPHVALRRAAPAGAP